MGHLGSRYIYIYIYFSWILDDVLKLMQANKQTNKQRNTQTRAMTRLYVCNLRWDVTKEQFRTFLWNKVGLDCWTQGSVWMHRPVWRPNHENHSSAYIENITAAEAQRCLTFLGGHWDRMVCTTKRLHIEIAQPRCLGLQYYWFFFWRSLYWWSFTEEAFTGEILLEKFYWRSYILSEMLLCWSSEASTGGGSSTGGSGSSTGGNGGSSGGNGGSTGGNGGSSGGEDARLLPLLPWQCMQCDWNMIFWIHCSHRMSEEEMNRRCRDMRMWVRVCFCVWILLENILLKSLYWRIFTEEILLEKFYWGIFTGEALLDEVLLEKFVLTDMDTGVAGWIYGTSTGKFFFVNTGCSKLFLQAHRPRREAPAKANGVCLNDNLLWKNSIVWVRDAPRCAFRMAAKEEEEEEEVEADPRVEKLPRPFRGKQRQGTVRFYWSMWFFSDWNKNFS